MSSYIFTLHHYLLIVNNLALCIFNDVIGLLFKLLDLNFMEMSLIKSDLALDTGLLNDTSKPRHFWIYKNYNCNFAIQIRSGIACLDFLHSKS